MEAKIVNFHIIRLQFFREVQQQFSHLYPFLKLKFLLKPDSNWINEYPDTDLHPAAIDLLHQDIGPSDAISITELENALQEWFGTKIRFCGKMACLGCPRRKLKTGHPGSTITMDMILNNVI